MTNQSIKKLRTVSVNERGQIVIPEDIRKDLGIEGATTLVIIEKGGELVIKKESEILEAVESEEKFWSALAEASLREVWENEKDEKVWKKYL